MQGEYTVRTGIGGSTGEVGVINANAEVLVVDVTDLDNVTAFVTVNTIAGTTSLSPEYTIDGTHWVAWGAAVVHGDLVSATGGVVRTLSDSNGMALRVKQVRLRSTALAGGGSYGFVAAGTKRAGF